MSAYQTTPAELHKLELEVKEFHHKQYNDNSSEEAQSQLQKYTYGTKKERIDKSESRQ